MWCQKKPGGSLFNYVGGLLIVVGSRVFMIKLSLLPYLCVCRYQTAEPYGSISDNQMARSRPDLRSFWDKHNWKISENFLRIHNKMPHSSIKNQKKTMIANDKKEWNKTSSSLKSLYFNYSSLPVSLPLIHKYGFFSNPQLTSLSGLYSHIVSFFWPEIMPYIS